MALRALWSWPFGLREPRRHRRLSTEEDSEARGDDAPEGAFRPDQVNAIGRRLVPQVPVFCVGGCGLCLSEPRRPVGYWDGCDGEARGTHGVVPRPSTRAGAGWFQPSASNLRLVRSEKP
jgi:hypothetical protein